jgi:hypothetical protein
MPMKILSGADKPFKNIYLSNLSLFLQQLPNPEPIRVKVHAKEKSITRRATLTAWKRYEELTKIHLPLPSSIKGQSLDIRLHAQR